MRILNISFRKLSAVNMIVPENILAYEDYVYEHFCTFSLYLKESLAEQAGSEVSKSSNRFLVVVLKLGKSPQ
eukprot:g11647.t1